MTLLCPPTSVSIMGHPATPSTQYGPGWDAPHRAFPGKMTRCSQLYAWALLGARYETTLVGCKAIAPGGSSPTSGTQHIYPQHLGLSAEGFILSHSGRILLPSAGSQLNPGAQQGSTKNTAPPNWPAMPGCRAGKAMTGMWTFRMPAMPRKPLLKVGAAQGILRAEAAQHRATARAPSPPCCRIPSCRDTRVPMCWGLAAGPSPKHGTPR